MTYIPLTRGYVAIIDDEDTYLAMHKWCANVRSDGRVYATRRVGRRVLYLHREVAGVSNEVEVDHHDGNTLNCRRHNLRPATHQQNGRNRKKNRTSASKYKGIRLQRHGRWEARIRVAGKLRSLGYFTTPEEAARAYDAAAIKAFGAFARPNFATNEHPSCARTEVH